LLINGNPVTPSDSLLKILHSDKAQTNAVEKYIKELDSSMKEENSEVKLATITRLTILSEGEPEVYYICLPSQNQLRMAPNTQKQTCTTGSTAVKTTNAPITSGSKWSTDDH